MNKIAYINNGSVFFSVEIDGKEYPFNYPCIAEGETVEALTGKSEEFFQLELLKNLYPESPCYNGSLDDWNDWITEGCWMIPDYPISEEDKYQLTPKEIAPFTKKQIKEGYIRQFYADYGEEVACINDQLTNPEKYAAYQQVRADADVRCKLFGL